MLAYPNSRGLAEAIPTIDAATARRGNIVKNKHTEKKKRANLNQRTKRRADTRAILKERLEKMQ